MMNNDMGAVRAVAADLGCDANLIDIARAILRKPDPASWFPWDDADAAAWMGCDVELAHEIGLVVLSEGEDVPYVMRRVS